MEAKNARKEAVGQVERDLNIQLKLQKNQL